MSDTIPRTAAAAAPRPPADRETWVGGRIDQRELEQLAERQGV